MKKSDKLIKIKIEWGILTFIFLRDIDIVLSFVLKTAIFFDGRWSSDL